MLETVFLKHFLFLDAAICDIICLMNEDEAKKILDFLARRCGYDELVVGENDYRKDPMSKYVLFARCYKCNRDFIVLLTSSNSISSGHPIVFSKLPSFVLVLNDIIEWTKSSLRVIVRKKFKYTDEWTWTCILKPSDTIDTLKVEMDLEVDHD